MSLLDDFHKWMNPPPAPYGMSGWYDRFFCSLTVVLVLAVMLLFWGFII